MGTQQSGPTHLAFFDFLGIDGFELEAVGITAASSPLSSSDVDEDDARPLDVGEGLAC